MSTQYGICPSCRLRRALRKDGTMRKHFRPNAFSYFKVVSCFGSLKPPLQEETEEKQEETEKKEEP